MCLYRPLGGGGLGENEVVPIYEELAHTADTGIIAYGSTLAELFEHAAYGMFDLMFDLATIHARHDRPVVAAGDAVEELLVDWLGELLIMAETEELALARFTVDRLEEGGVQGAAGGAPFAEVELRGPPVKAVTYHDLAVVRIPDGWWARVIFDI